MKKEEKKKEKVQEEVIPEKVEEENSKIEALQEKIIKEKCDNVELKAEIEKEREENRELEKENRNLRISNSFFRVVFFVIFTIIVFVGGWYLGTKLVDLEEYIYGDTVNPLSDKHVDFSKEDANDALNNLYGEFLANNGFISKVLYNSEVPDSLDLVEDDLYRLSVVPKVDESLYENSIYSYVTYDNYISEYSKLYGDTSDLEEKLLDVSTYPKLIDGDKVIYNFYLDIGVEASFNAERIEYTAADKIYTMTGTYQELGTEFCLLSGSVVNGTFELKYKVNNDGSRNITSMIITKTDMIIENGSSEKVD